MKKIITATIITSALIGTGAFALTTQQPVKEDKQVTQKTNATKQESVQSEATPAVTEVQPETTPTPTVSQPVSQVAPVQSVLSTNDLIAQYGWENMRGAIDYYASNIPDYFTDAKRANTFQLIYDCGLVFSTAANQDATNKTNALYMFNTRLQSSGGASKNGFARVASACKLDITNYGLEPYTN